MARSLETFCENSAVYTIAFYCTSVLVYIFVAGTSSALETLQSTAFGWNTICSVDNL